MLITDKWQPFNGVACTTWPDTVPFDVEGMHSDGCRKIWTVTSFNFLDSLTGKDLVSIRICNVQDPELEFVRNLIAETIPTSEPGISTRYQPNRIREGSLDKHYTTAVVRGIVKKYGLLDIDKVDVNLPRWASEKLPLNRHKAVTKWLNDVNNDDYQIHDDYAEEILGNRLLAVRNYSTGRRVISPMGHSLAYTTAQKIYWRINGAGTLMEFGRDLKVTVGELRGRSRQMIAHKAVYHAGRQIITIGCQRIPFSALQELAAREGWSEKAPYA